MPARLRFAKLDCNPILSNLAGGCLRAAMREERPNLGFHFLRARQGHPEFSEDEVLGPTPAGTKRMPGACTLQGSACTPRFLPRRLRCLRRYGPGGIAGCPQPNNAMLSRTPSPKLLNPTTKINRYVPKAQTPEASQMPYNPARG